LRVPEWSGKPVPFANANEVRLGAPVAALGFTGGAAITPRFGQVLALHAYDEGRIIESSAPFNSGSSGGGLFDAGGALVGLLTFRLRNSVVSYYSVPVQWIREALPVESQWTSVHPLEATTPFWQGEPEELPYFMRAKALEAQGAWSRALELADKWAVASPQEAGPMMARARALQELHQPKAAAAAFKNASRLSPDDPSAWYGLALASAQAGDGEASRRAEARLDALDHAMATELAARLAGLDAGG
jgi:tetratricopeptide (TPR) repeat protein